MTLEASSLHHMARSLYTVILRLPLYCGLSLKLLTLESLSMCQLLQLPQPVQQIYHLLHHLKKTCSLYKAVSTVRVAIVSLIIITLQILAIRYFHQTQLLVVKETKGCCRCHTLRYPTCAKGLYETFYFCVKAFLFGNFSSHHRDSQLNTF